MQQQEAEITSGIASGPATRARVEHAELVAHAADLRRLLHEKAQRKKRKRIAEGTKKNYLRIQKMFCEKFMKKYFPEVPLAHDLDTFLENPLCAEHLKNKEYMNNENIVLLFLEALPEFCVKDAADLGESTFGSARSAIRDLWNKVGQLWPSDSPFEREIADWYKGNTRTIAEHRLSGRTKANIGKRHMFFDLYIALAKRYFNDGLLFEWAYHVLTWNLMTRGCSTSALRWSHIQAANDNCVFIIPKSKSDQEGVKLDPKHVYVNTLNPYICPIFALGMYTLCLKVQHHSEIFPGGAQLSRFAKALSRAKSRNAAIVDMLRTQGYTPEDIGVHSIRKGSASYAANGIVGMTPSISAICLRAGWTQGAIKDKYLKYEHAQDTYLGRVLAGYPVTGPQAVLFGSLPPTWGRNIHHPEVVKALSVAFPCTNHEDFPVSALGLFNRMLAVIVKNHWWIENVALKNIADHDHPYFSTMFYLNKFPEKLHDLLDQDTSLMTPTGVPQYIDTLVEVRDTKKLVLAIINVHLPNSRDETIAAVVKVLDERVSDGSMSLHQANTIRLLAEKFERLEQLITGAQQPQQPVTTAQQPAIDMPANVRRMGVTPWNEWKHDDNRWFAIPPKCKYPNPTSGVMTLLWQFYHGRVLEGTNGNIQIMPVRKMNPRNVPANTKKDERTGIKTTRARSRLSEAKQFVHFLENNISHNWDDQDDRGYRIPPLRQDVQKMFAHANTILRNCCPTSQQPHKRRKTSNQKGWTTHLRDVRKWKRENQISGHLSTVLVDIDDIDD